MDSQLAQRGYSGLAAWQVIVQSDACHPEWDVQMHAAYLASEEGLEISTAAIADALGREQ